MTTLALAKTLRFSVLSAWPSPPAPPRDGPGGSTRFFGARSLERPGHLPSGLFDALASIACQDGGRGNRKVPAGRDVKYWGGATNPATGAAEPWRDGTTDAAITDPEVIAREQVRKAEVEAEDKHLCPSTEAHAEALHARGVRADFLVALTVDLHLWDWKTWEVRSMPFRGSVGGELFISSLFPPSSVRKATTKKSPQVVQFLAKPATEGHGRCRLADHPAVRPFTGPAAVFASHCWAGRWGDLVAAACAGGRMDRFVWLDVFAVRRRGRGGQWLLVCQRCCSRGPY